MNKKDKFPQIMLITVAVIITVTVLVAGYFDSPKYNETKSYDISDSVVLPDVTFAALKPESGKIDLNSATLEELMTLEQIGEARAQAIIDYRNSNMGFYSVDDILFIDKIPRSVFEKIRNKVTVGTYTEVTSDVF